MIKQKNRISQPLVNTLFVLVFAVRPALLLKTRWRLSIKPVN